MKTAKTNKSYEIDIKKKYLSNKKQGILRDDLYKLTPRSIKNICLNLVDENLSNDDKKVMEKFFELKNEDHLFAKIKKYEIDGFRPICRFLSGKTETIQQYFAIELIAIIINFNPRPYKNYRTNIIENNTDDEKEDDLVIIPTSSENLKKINSPVNDSIAETKDVKKRSTASKFNIKIIILSTIILLSAITFIYINKTRWMIWQDDHYETVNFNLNKYDINQLKQYKKDRILNFKKIEPDCSTIFFKKDGSENLWYGKNLKGELEYFTDLGLHPDTGKTLKKITKYMIKTYICNTY